MIDSKAVFRSDVFRSACNFSKSPLNRASYLLKLEGIDAFDERDTKMDHDFLISQIELREELELLRLKQNPDDLEDYLDKVEDQIQTKIDLISDAFKENKGHLEIKKDVRELKFYEQLLSESSKLMDEWL